MSSGFAISLDCRRFAWPSPLGLDYSEPHGSLYTVRSNFGADLVKFETDRILLAADMAGTLLFAVEGATAAISGHLDLLGLIVLAFATALGGGIVRDILIGDVPPASLRDWRYAALAFVGGAIVFFLHHFVQAIPPNLIMVLDAAGLAFFAIAGTQKALLHKLHPFIAVLLGTITAVGGGTIRDLFLARTPRVLEADVYATAALAGSVLMILLLRLRLAPSLAATAGGIVCFLLRVVSVWEHWNLPKVGN
jgi:uncharacterized membrane protein YeiH